MTENKYNNGKIYRIVSNVTGENYYGSTTEPTLARRLAKHKGNYRDYLKGKGTYITSFKILETEDYEIVLVENVNCKSKSELHQRERFYIENNNCVNKFIPCRSNKEYKDDNKDKIKEYREQNKQRIHTYHKEYHLKNKDKINAYKKEYRQQHQEKYEKYYQNNKDKIKQYYGDNKEAIQAYKNEKHDCECGGKFTTAGRARHCKTHLHIDYIKQQENNKFRICKNDFDFLFEIDSIALLPKAYTNIIIFS